jgi:hypothetical protein
VENGEKIFGEFWFSAPDRAVENHEFATVEFDKVLNKLESKSRKSVTVGNHKAEFFSIKESSQ